MGSIMRALSIHEASFPIYAELSPGGGNIVACLRLQGELDVDLAAAGLQKLMAAEPTLRLGYRWLKREDQPENYYFETVAGAALPFQAVAINGDDGLDITIAKTSTALLNQPFQCGDLLWRARLLSHGDEHCLVFAISHSLSDGTSVNYLLKRWLQSLNQAKPLVAAGEQIGAPLWHYMPHNIAGFFGAFRSLGILSTFMKAQKLADQGLTFKVDTNVPAMEHRCRATYRTVDQPTFEQLVELVKSNGKSIHGLLGAATLRAFLAECQQSGRLKSLKETFSMPFVTTVNVRDKIEPVLDDTSAGCYSSGVTSMVEIDQKRIADQDLQTTWAIGDQIASGVTEALEQDQHWKVLRIYKLAGLKGLKKMFVDSSEKSLATPISFANMGRVDFNNESLAVNAFQVYAGFHVSGAGVNVTANSLNGVLTICFTCPEPVVGQATLDSYADSVVSLLQQWATLVNNT